MLVGINTNRIVEVEKPVYDIIDEYDDDNRFRREDKYKEAYNSIEKAGKEHGLFSGFKPKKVTLGIRTAGAVKDLHKKGLTQLILEITKSCNLNCRYCLAAGKYAGPGTSKMHMSEGKRCQAKNHSAEDLNLRLYQLENYQKGELLLSILAYKKRDIYFIDKTANAMPIEILYQLSTFMENLSSQGAFVLYFNEASSPGDKFLAWHIF